MKTLQEWKNSDKSLKDFLNKGDQVNSEMVDYFREILPPITNGKRLQVGEPANHKKRDGVYKPVYTTFEKEKGKWFYKGRQFRKRTEKEMIQTVKNTIKIIKENKLNLINDDLPITKNDIKTVEAIKHHLFKSDDCIYLITTKDNQQYELAFITGYAHFKAV